VHCQLVVYFNVAVILYFTESTMCAHLGDFFYSDGLNAVIEIELIGLSLSHFELPVVPPVSSLAIFVNVSVALFCNRTNLTRSTCRTMRLSSSRTSLS
jgi:hypothetical protein